ncbi:MAG: hypothetical protein HYV63_02410 [Candidatus Schekmanbacteria bacterium]|nr:hypothetical protein [Candidatus Schekmanbacteria bacterium]
MAIGATEAGRIADYSGRGPGTVATEDGVTDVEKPTFVAPGYLTNGAGASFRGTSAAAPVAGALVALHLEQQRRRTGSFPERSQTVAALAGLATAIDPECQRCEGNSYPRTYGAGQVKIAWVESEQRTGPECTGPDGRVLPAAECPEHIGDRASDRGSAGAAARPSMPAADCELLSGNRFTSGTWLSWRGNRPGGSEDPVLSLSHRDSLLEARMDVPISAPTRDDVRGNGWVRIQPAQDVYLGAGAEMLAHFPELDRSPYTTFVITTHAITADERSIVARACIGDCDCYDGNGCEAEPVSLGGRREAPISREALGIAEGFAYDMGPGKPLEPAPSSATAGAWVVMVSIEFLGLIQGDSIFFANDYVTLFPLVAPPQ